MSDSKKLFVQSTLCEKCPYLEFFWSVFSRIRTEYSVSLPILSECKKIPTRKSPNTNTFHALLIFKAFFTNKAYYKQFGKYIPKRSFRPLKTFRILFQIISGICKKIYGVLSLLLYYQILQKKRWLIFSNYQVPWYWWRDEMMIWLLG